MSYGCCEVAWEQLGLPWRRNDTTASPSAGEALMVRETPDSLTVAGKDFEYCFDKRMGKLVSLKYQGKILIQDGPQLNVWRAPLANEMDEWATDASHLTYRTPSMGEDPANNWRSLGLDRLTYTLEWFSVLANDSRRVVIDVAGHAEGSSYATAFDNRFRYSIDPRGALTIQNSVTPQGLMPAWLQRIGLQLILSKDLQQVSWYGRGPYENYPDCKTGARIGVYRDTVNGMVEPYLIPQDFGLRTDNRWVRFENADGVGLKMQGDRWFNFNAYPFATDNLTRARYAYQLVPLDGITLNFDYATSGVGCTAISLLNQYRVLPQPYAYTVHLTPCSKCEEYD